MTEGTYPTQKEALVRLPDEPGDRNSREFRGI